ncbi:MAG: hypothetical protein SGARI_000390 [Bacillariaceae sp.]
MTGRSFDWNYSFDDYLMIFPRGQSMDGGLQESQDEYSLEWVSKYGSIVASAIGLLEDEDELKPGAQCDTMNLEQDMATDGINEMGLAAHILYLGENDVYQTPGPDKNGLSPWRWVRYILDNFATVTEAVEAMGTVKIVPIKLCRAKLFNVHMHIEDSFGDSAIFELVNHELVIYHNHNTTVMTNDPEYKTQVENYDKYVQLGLPEHLPGSISSQDRFVRLSYYLPYLPNSNSATESVSKNNSLANMKSLMASSAVPRGAPGSETGSGSDNDSYPTIWTSYTDLSNKRYYFDWLSTLNTIWIDIEDANLEEGSPVLKIHPQEESLVGNIYCDFTTLDGESICGNEGRRNLRGS